MTYDFIGYARRFAQVLIGKVEPSVVAVSELASEIQQMVGRGVDQALKAVYDQALYEEVPPDILGLMERLNETTVEPVHFVPPRMRQGASNGHY